jgi:hypothetical protein
MLDTLSGGRLEIAVGPGGVFEAYFWARRAIRRSIARRPGVNYLSGALQLGSLSRDQARCSIELFTTGVMPHYRRAPALVD